MLAFSFSTRHSTLTENLNEYNPEVKVLQQDLNANGANIAEDGYFGEYTLDAVIAFQNSVGLDPDGSVGPLTWGKLESSSAKSSSVTGEGMGNLSYTDEMKNAGVRITIIDGKQYYDFSKRINDMIIRNTKECAKHKGNITYGYWGTSMDYGPTLLFMGGGTAAVGFWQSQKYGSPYWGDSKEDHESIQEGIDWYNNTHKSN